jgi:hypothetical protein
MRYSCGKVPHYDRKECHHGHEGPKFRVMVAGYYVPVCQEAYNFAKSRGMRTSKGGTVENNVPFDEKIPAIRLNHNV